MIDSSKRGVRKGSSLLPDIKTSKLGAMTEIVDALFEEYYKSQGRL